MAIEVREDGVAVGIRLPPKDPITGKYLAHGNGCSYCNNCFDCPYPFCKRYERRRDYERQLNMI